LLFGSLLAGLAQQLLGFGVTCIFWGTAPIVFGSIFAVTQYSDNGEVCKV